MYMPPKTEYFIADDLLKSVEKTKRHNHYRYADSSSHSSKPDDKP
jgi:hypothetical protein